MVLTNREANAKVRRTHVDVIAGGGDTKAPGRGTGPPKSAVPLSGTRDSSGARSAGLRPRLKPMPPCGLNGTLEFQVSSCRSQLIKGAARAVLRPRRFAEKRDAFAGGVGKNPTFANVRRAWATQRIYEAAFSIRSTRCKSSSVSTPTVSKGVSATWIATPLSRNRNCSRRSLRSSCDSGHKQKASSAGLRYA